MKTVKIIVIIITVFVVGFLSIGLIISETTYTTEVSVDKPVATVFATFNDTSKLKKWVSEFKSIETIEEKPGKEGSRYRIKMDNNGQEVIMQKKVLAFIPNEKMTFYYDTGEGSMLKKDTYVFKAKGDKTIITHEAACRSNGYLMACMFPIFKSKFKNQDQKYLNNFKAFIEQE